MLWLYDKIFAEIKHGHWQENGWVDKRAILMVYFNFNVPLSK